MAARVVSPRFVGRQVELACLRKAVEDSVSGSAVAVLVAGEAGIGKSRLVGELISVARGDGVHVLTGACVALGAESLPYAPFTQALGELADALGQEAVEQLVGGVARADLGRLVPQLRAPQDESRPAWAADRAMLFQAVLRVLEGAAQMRPLLVVIEDLHWADASSRELLGFLLGRLRGSILIVATYRSDELHRRHPLRPLLAEAARSERVVRLDVPPLSTGEVAEQLLEIADGQPAQEVLATILERAEGNPFFAEELLAAGGGGELPPVLAEVLAARLTALSDAANEVVRIAAVAGRRVRHDLLAAVCGRDPIDLVGGLRDATAQHVLVADAEGAYAFRHALLQETAYAELLPGERVALHGAYAAALAANPRWAASPLGAAGELAFHYAAARDPARALSAAIAAAGGAVESYALREAHALYEHALALWDELSDPAAVAGCEHAQLLERCADAATLAGAVNRAIALVRKALEHVDVARDPARAALLHWRLARLLWNSGEGTGALAAHHVAVASMPTEPSAERAMLLAADGHVLVLAARYQESKARCVEAIDVARAAGALREEGYALNTLGGALSRLGEAEAAVACLEQALAIAESIGSVDDERRGYGNLTVVLEELGMLQRAVDVGRAGVARLDALGYEAGGATVRCATASALRSAGEWEEADLLAAQALEVTTSDATAWMGREVRGCVAARRGDFAAAHAILEPAGQDWSTGYADFRADLDAARIELALGEGRHAVARDLIDGGLQAFAGSEGQHHLQRLIALGLRADADQACRSSTNERGRARARDHARLLIKASRGMRSELAARGSVLTQRSGVLRGQCEAEYARAEGSHDAALWEQAAQAWAQIGQPYELAYARWRQAEAHLAVAERDGAADAVREAASIAARLGAGPLLSDIEALARRARIRLTATAEGTDAADAAKLGLSRRELQVLALVAAGHTNREIAAQLYIAEKTASVHVSHILTKLGVSNRGQASAVAQRLDLLSEQPAR